MYSELMRLIKFRDVDAQGGNTAGDDGENTQPDPDAIYKERLNKATAASFGKGQGTGLKKAADIIERLLTVSDDEVESIFDSLEDEKIKARYKDLLKLRAKPEDDEKKIKKIDEDTKALIAKHKTEIEQLKKESTQTIEALKTIRKKDKIETEVTKEISAIAESLSMPEMMIEHFSDKYNYEVAENGEIYPLDDDGDRMKNPDDWSEMNLAAFIKYKLEKDPKLNKGWKVSTNMLKGSGSQTGGGKTAGNRFNPKTVTLDEFTKDKAKFYDNLKNSIPQN